MNTTYWMILGILLLLAVFDLIVGVSNDAANFLNAALGCKAAKRRTVLAFAAVGVLLGASFSGGMMEIARNGVFEPSLFRFHDIMILFMAVMLTDVLLLDMFNTLGLPTSTTVSLVFELLGAGVAVALAATASGTGLSDSLADYIHEAKAFGIISGIFCSVAVAFVCGTVVMWFSRLLFSFRHGRGYRSLSALWAAVSMTSITWFAVFKGLKHSVLVQPETLDWLSAHLPLATACVFSGWLLIFAAGQFLLRLNMLRFVVLCGTAALALAFAGNDLVNFIGVFMAAESACRAAAATAAAGGNAAALPMAVLAEPVQAEPLYLLGAGVIMVAALCFSRKARRVTETEIKLARSRRGDKERFGSCLPARLLVRHTMQAAELLRHLVPERAARWVNGRFAPADDAEDNGAAYDLIRGSVNLTVASLLISLATSLKLPLSTTYVTFMVAMGSALADRAWGRESAVYRITGVLTVIGGWFLTAAAACTAAFLVATCMVYGGTAAMAVLVCATLGLMLRSAFRKKEDEEEEWQLPQTEAELQRCRNRLAEGMEQMLRLHRESVAAMLQDDVTSMKQIRKQCKQLRRRWEEEQTQLLRHLPELPADLAASGENLFRAETHAAAMSLHLHALAKAGYRHLADFLGALTPQQGAELMRLAEQTGSLTDKLRSAAADTLQQQASELDTLFSDALARHLMHHAESETDLRRGLLFLTLLNETRGMVAQAFHLANSLSQKTSA